GLRRGWKLGRPGGRGALSPRGALRGPQAAGARHPRQGRTTFSGVFRGLRHNFGRARHVNRTCLEGRSLLDSSRFSSMIRRLFLGSFLAALLVPAACSVSFSSAESKGGAPATEPPLNDDDAASNGGSGAR